MMPQSEITEKYTSECIAIFC